MVDIEVVEREFEVISIIGCRFGQAGRDELIIGQSAVVIDIHVSDDLLDVLVVRVVIMPMEIF